MLDRKIPIDTSSIAYTPTSDDLPRRIADFDTLGEALDFAASGKRGMNFHDARGTLLRAYPYSELRTDARLQVARFAEGRWRVELHDGSTLTGASIVQAAFASALSFAVGGVLPLLVAWLAKGHVIPAVSGG